MQYKLHFTLHSCASYFQDQLCMSLGSAHLLQRGGLMDLIPLVSKKKPESPKWWHAKSAILKIRAFCVLEVSVIVKLTSSYHFLTHL